MHFFTTLQTIQLTLTTVLQLLMIHFDDKFPLTFYFIYFAVFDHFSLQLIFTQLKSVNFKL